MEHIYTAMKAAGCETGSHESDLYVKDTPRAREILKEHRPGRREEMFTSAIDGTRWFDLPFMFLPFWESKAS